MKLILITSPTYFTEEAILINSMFDAGLDTLHLRKPDSNLEMYEQLLIQIDRQWLDRIVIHEHFSLKEKHSLKGIHLNKRNPNIPENYTGHVSCSCHSIDEIKAWKNKYNYVFLSPIFNSISKTGYLSKFSEQDLIQAKQEGIIDHKIIALGGIDIANISRVKSYGFGGAAIMGGLWSQLGHDIPKDIYTATNYLKKLYKSLY
ncbi:MAG: thiamine phosphate synthase [Bacteroides sp.]|nr:thiamine phosphate synthase [Roseburia sp.]MCM1346679.1 thiamine phosphate synthase [Bacteroides sp.]MCM1421247.1 thiamine phosphate synthase [Bacteroides sp.]